MRADIVPGATFPDYELPDHVGARRRLSELQGNDPVALVLARGGYCPREHRQHMWMVDMEPELVLSYCRFVTVSTDSVMASLEWRSRLGAHWPFLSDEGRVIQQDLDIHEFTDPAHNAMVPHTILLEPGLRVYKSYVGYWYWGRPSPDEIRQDFRALSIRCRPDWDITTAELRANWQTGDKSLFYPYRKK